MRLFALPNKTCEGREVLGVEIAADVTAKDGKPGFLNMGVHHAREWPAGEHAMEWAYELVNGYKAGDARATNIVRDSRNLVVPIVNPDGFNDSRSAAAAGDDGRDETVDDTVYIAAPPAASTGARTAASPDTQTALCPISVGLAENGVDPNRNYGEFWGGPGSDTNPATQTYRGPAPFSEPESRNIQWLVSHNQVMTLITNHTTAGLVLRAPGLAAVGDPVDENRGYKQLGDDDGQAERLLQPEGLRALRHHRHDRGLELQRHRRLRLHVRALLRRAQLRRPATATRPHSTRATRRWPRSGTATSARPTTSTTRADQASTARATARRTTSRPRATIDEARHSMIEGTAPAGHDAAADQGLQDRGVRPGAVTRRRPPRLDPRRRRRPGPSAGT